MRSQYNSKDLFTLYDKAGKQEEQREFDKNFLKLATKIISKGETQLTIEDKKIFSKIELFAQFEKAGNREKMEQLLGMRITRIDRWMQKHFKHQSKNNKELGLASVPFDKGGVVRLR